MYQSILFEHVPELMKFLNGVIPTSGDTPILESAYKISRMLHGSTSNSADAAFSSPKWGALYIRVKLNW